MAKIEILTPVHVGTGVIVESPSYKQLGNTLERYPFEDILTTIPGTILTDPKFLEFLTNEQKSKREAYTKIRQYAKYRQIKPVYSVSWNQIKPFEQVSLDIEEQVKDLDQPYIPGSTIKGALEDAWKYWFLKRNFDSIKPHLPRVLEDISHARNGEVPEGFVLELFESVEKNEANEFFRDLQGCLLVSDVYFHKMEILHMKRMKPVYNRNDEVDNASDIITIRPECIQSGQIGLVDCLWTVDDCKKQMLKKRLKKTGRLTYWKEAIIDSLTTESLLEACNEYVYDNLYPEFSDEKIDFYNLIDDSIYRFLEKLDSELKKMPEAKGIAYLRVGRYTNYFFKSISYLFKSKDEEMYRRYFDSVFSPVKGNSRKKERPSPDSMPKTVSIFENEDGSFLPGFIKVTL